MKAAQAAQAAAEKAGKKEKGSEKQKQKEEEERKKEEERITKAAAEAAEKAAVAEKAAAKAAADLAEAKKTAAEEKAKLEAAVKTAEAAVAAAAKKAEASATEQVKQLEQQLKEQTEAVSTAKAALEKAEKAQKEAVDKLKVRGLGVGGRVHTWVGGCGRVCVGRWVRACVLVVLVAGRGDGLCLLQHGKSSAGEGRDGAKGGCRETQGVRVCGRMGGYYSWVRAVGQAGGRGQVLGVRWCVHAHLRVRVGSRERRSARQKQHWRRQNRRKKRL